MTESITIPRVLDLPEGEDWALLREKGLEHIRKLAGKLWTDHNLHDPGITILELLSYALTDLNYRTRFPTEDLLAFSPDDKDAENKSFHTARKIFPNNPVTYNDFRKSMIDVDGVQNAWIRKTDNCGQPVYTDCENEKLTLTPPLGEGASDELALGIRGLYDVMVLFEPDILAHNKLKLYYDIVDGSDLNTLHVEITLPDFSTVPAEIFSLDSEVSLTLTVDELLPVGTRKFHVKGDVEISDGTTSVILTCGFDVLSGADELSDVSGWTSNFIDALVADPGFVLLYIENLEMVAAYIEDVRRRLHSVRNLCEDYCDIGLVKCQELALCLEIEMKPEVSINETLATIYFEIDRFLNPPVNFYSLEEMLDDGYTSDTAYEGPALEHGFIKEKELSKSDLRQFIYASDLINIIMDVEGVISVRTLELNLLDAYGGLTGSSETWCIEIPDYSRTVPKLNLNRSSVTFFRGGLPYFPNLGKVRRYLRDLRAAERTARMGILGSDIDIPEGTFRDLGDYEPVANDFPVVYGIGEDGLPRSADEERKARARQLKTYLLFFEQLIANYLSQLSQVRELFTWSEADDLADVVPTYYSQVVSRMKGVEDLYVDYAGLGADLRDLDETDEQRLDRRNRFLDHLLGRFAEEMTEYSLILFSRNIDEGEDSDLVYKEELLRDKARFLRDYPAMSGDRFRSFDMLSDDFWYTNENITGYQRRVGRALGVDDVSRHFLSKYSFYIDRVLIEDPGSPGELLERFQYVFDFSLRTPAGVKDYIIRSAEFYEEEYLAESALERHIPLLVLGRYGVDPDADPNVDGKFGARVVEFDDIAHILAYSNLFDTAPERDEALVYLRWHIANRYYCLPEGLLPRIETSPDIRILFDIVLDVEFTEDVFTETVVTFTTTTDYPTAGDARLASIEIFESWKYVALAADAGNTLALVDREETVFALSQAFATEDEAAAVLKAAEAAFAWVPDCNEEGLHVVEHLLIRPLTEADGDEALLPACVTCPDESLTSSQDFLVVKCSTEVDDDYAVSPVNEFRDSVTVIDFAEENDTITFQNEADEPILMSGWTLWSVVGEQGFRFPDNYVLEPGETVTIWSGKGTKSKHDGEANLFWSAAYKWNNDGDRAILLTGDHRIITRYPEEEFPVTGANYQLLYGKLRLDLLDVEEELVQVVNESELSVNLEGWAIMSMTGLQMYTFPAGTFIEPGQTLSLYSGKEGNAKSKAVPGGVFWAGNFKWNNAGDSAAFMRPDGYVVSTINSEGAADPQYFFKVIRVSDSQLMLMSELYETRNERDIAHLKMFEYGVDFDNFELVEAGDDLYGFRLLEGPEGEVLVPGAEDYAESNETASDDVQSLVDYFYGFTDQGEATDTGDSVDDYPDTLCTYENDPYSFRLSLVMPGWTENFGAPDFRAFAERQIRLETPAHLSPKICWISRWQMRKFELAWKNWLEANRAWREGLRGVSAVVIRYKLDTPISFRVWNDDPGNPGAEVIAEFSNIGAIDHEFTVVAPDNGLLPETIYLEDGDITGTPLAITVGGSYNGSQFKLLESVPYYTYQLRQLIALLGDLRNIYPFGSRLHDCESENDSEKIILDNSTLGFF